MTTGSAIYFSENDADAVIDHSRLYTRWTSAKCGSLRNALYVDSQYCDFLAIFCSEFADAVAFLEEDRLKNFSHRHILTTLLPVAMCPSVITGVQTMFGINDFTEQGQL